MTQHIALKDVGKGEYRWIEYIQTLLRLNGDGLVKGIQYVPLISCKIKGDCVFVLFKSILQKTNRLF